MFVSQLMRCFRIFEKGTLIGVFIHLINSRKQHNRFAINAFRLIRIELTASNYRRTNYLSGNETCNIALHRKFAFDGATIVNKICGCVNKNIILL